MNIKQIIFFIYIFFLQTTIAQNGKISYRAVMFDTIVNNEMLKKMKNEIESMEFTLYYDKEHSLFKKEAYIAKNQQDASIASIIAQINEDWYQYNTDKISFTFQEVKGKVYQVIHDKMKDWTLLNETKKIDGYTCFKATREEFNVRSQKFFNIIAWYTPEIPASYGPIGAGGLPGLVLQLKHAGKVTYIVNKIVLNPYDWEAITKPEIGERVNPKQIVKLMRMARKVTPD